MFTGLVADTGTVESLERNGDGVRQQIRKRQKALIKKAAPPYPLIGSTNRLPLLSSFITVSALLPTLAIAASISGFDFLKCLHQYRASSSLEMSTQFRGLFTDEVVSMTQ